MQSKEKHTVIELMWQVLSILAAICAMILIMFSFTLISVVATSIRNDYKLVMGIIYIFAQTAIFTLCIFKLRSIVGTIISKDPFNNENVIRFKKIAIYVLFSGVIDFAVNLLNGPPQHGLRLLKFGDFYISPTTIVLLIVACFAALMSETFSMAMNIKNENDLTI